ncbi:MAG TPA: ATP-binding cassette domain-containing protein [Mycobacteriales bacterium]
MIRFERVTFAYPGAATPALRDVDLTIGDGELCLVVGRTGSGKSTLLRAVNGLVPHFSGGTLTGHVTVGGLDTRDHRPRDLADLVGFVGQDPAAGFVTDTVEDELAYAMENLGLAPATMRRRVEDVLDLLGLADLRGRALSSLSAGQQQRVAVGSVLTAHPRVLVLDEPTSALDPPAAEEVLAALQRLVHDLGLTVVLAEHRLERVVQYADRVVLVTGPEVTDGAPADVMADAPVAPPVVRLGRLARWSPLPLSVRDARRAAAGLDLAEPPAPPAPAAGEVVASTERLGARYGDLVALRDVTLDLRAGQVVALMGRNGAGKTTLLAHLVGLRKPSAGSVTVGGVAPHGRPGREMARLVGLVPQDPGRLLYGDSVADECGGADREAGLPPGTTAKVLDRLAPWLPPDRHPSDLSEGERLTLALAVVLGGEPPLVLLDEPTRGLDYAAKTRLVPVLRDLARRGHAVLLSTHDVELAAELTDRTVVLADGEVVANGPTREVVRQSPAFAPQVTKVLGGGWLTVAEVEAALA